jgi:hypothetical protein
MLKERFITLYTRSRVNTVVWGLSFVFILSYTIASGFLQNWFFLGTGIIGMTAPFFIRRELLRQYHLTKFFFKISGPLILISILATPFIFGSLNNIPLPIRIFAFLYISLLSSSFFWVASDESLFSAEEQ